MAIIKYYEVKCDKCNKLIKICYYYKPNITELRKLCGRTRINNGSIIIVCKECVEREKNSINERC